VSFLEGGDDSREGLADFTREGEAFSRLVRIEKKEWDEIPNIASTMWSVSLMALGKSSVKGMERFSSCLDRR
jgi:hypothetical protein